jgi:hypothetical protein
LKVLIHFVNHSDVDSAGGEDSVWVPRRAPWYPGRHLPGGRRRRGDPPKQRVVCSQGFGSCITR